MKRREIVEAPTVASIFPLRFFKPASGESAYQSRTEKGHWWFAIGKTRFEKGVEIIGYANFTDPIYSNSGQDAGYGELLQQPQMRPTLSVMVSCDERTAQALKQRMYERSGKTEALRYGCVWQEDGVRNETVWKCLALFESFQQDEKVKMGFVITYCPPAQFMEFTKL